MVTERRRKSRPRLPVDDDEESDGTQADEEPLARSRARLANVDTGTRRRCVVVSASRRSLIEDDKGRRQCMLVWCLIPTIVCSFIYALFSLPFSLSIYDATLSAGTTS
ncbi:hypothetical protein V8E53_010385 [Lactarius tabidus]|jgi:hypothetical protein